MSIFFAFAALAAVFFMALTVIEGGAEELPDGGEIRKELDMLLCGKAAINIYTGGKKNDE